MYIYDPNWVSEPPLSQDRTQSFPQPTEPRTTRSGKQHSMAEQKPPKVYKTSGPKLLRLTDCRGAYRALEMFKAVPFARHAKMGGGGNKGYDCMAMCQDKLYRFAAGFEVGFGWAEETLRTDGS